MFPDRARIHLKAGEGGRGCVSFRREKYVGKGGPDGGDGGKGGDILLEANDKIQTLQHFRYQTQFKSSPGRHGGRNKKRGKDGKLLVINVPKGTVITDVASGNILADLVDGGSVFLAAKGGRGGRGNAGRRTSRNKVDEAVEVGSCGEEKTVDLELRLVADVALIGCPNAGKSLLLSQISSAKPKVAVYPFTTQMPCLGIVEYSPFKTLKMVEIPALIRGSHEGKGLGDGFLRHARRVKLILRVIDLSDNPYQDFLTINEELKLYNSQLPSKPQIIVGNKIDVPGSVKNFRCMVEKINENNFPNSGMVIISALKKQGLDELLRAIRISLGEEGR